MHLTTTALVYLCLAATTTADIGPIYMNWPDPSQKSNLSAPLNLEYEYSQHRYFRTLTGMDVLFYFMLNHSDEGHWIEPIKMNETLAGGRGAIHWNPSAILESLEEEGVFMASGRVHFFEVRRHEHNGDVGVMEYSDKYAVEADKRVDNSAHLTWRTGVLGLQGLAVAAVAVL